MATSSRLRTKGGRACARRSRRTDRTDRNQAHTSSGLRETSRFRRVRHSRPVLPACQGRGGRIWTSAEPGVTVGPPGGRPPARGGHRGGLTEGECRCPSGVWAPRAVLVVVGLIFLVGVFPLTRLWPSGWRWGTGHSDYQLMILGVYATLGVVLLIASRDPLAHRSLIWFTVCRAWCTPSSWVDRRWPIGPSGAICWETCRPC